MSEGQFHITVGISPSKGLSLEEDIRLIKAALLYADNVKLYSHVSSMMMALLKLKEFPPEKQLSFWKNIIPYVTSRRKCKQSLSNIKRYKGIQKNPHPSREDLQFLKATEELNKKQWEHFTNLALDTADKAGVNSLKRVLNSGLLQIHSFKDLESDKNIIEFATDCIAGAYNEKSKQKRSPQIEKHEDSLIWEFVEELTTAIIDGYTHPLFDAGTSNLIRSIIRVNVIGFSNAQVDKSKQSGLAAKLLIKLPVFDKATIDEILDIRNVLLKYLIQFRSAIIQFADSIESAQWDEDFPIEAEKIFNRDVNPAILDIEEEIKANRFLSSLMRKVVDKSLFMPSGAALHIILSQFKSLPNYIIEGLGISAMAGAVVYDAFREWSEKKRQIEKNNLYFYYLAGKQLN